MHGWSGTGSRAYTRVHVGRGNQSGYSRVGGWGEEGSHASTQAEGKHGDQSRYPGPRRAFGPVRVRSSAWKFLPVHSGPGKLGPESFGEETLKVSSGKLGPESFAEETLREGVRGRETTGGKERGTGTRREWGGRQEMQESLVQFMHKANRKFGF